MEFKIEKKYIVHKYWYLKRMNGHLLFTNQPNITFEKDALPSESSNPAFHNPKRDLFGKCIVGKNKYSRGNAWLKKCPVISHLAGYAKQNYVIESCAINRCSIRWSHIVKYVFI